MFSFVENNHKVNMFAMRFLDNLFCHCSKWSKSCISELECYRSEDSFTNRSLSFLIDKSDSIISEAKVGTIFSLNFFLYSYYYTSLYWSFIDRSTWWSGLDSYTDNISDSSKSRLWSFDYSNDFCYFSSAVVCDNDFWFLLYHWTSRN